MDRAEVLVFSTLVAMHGPEAMRATIRVPDEVEVVGRIKRFAAALASAKRDGMATHMMQSVDFVGALGRKALAGPSINPAG